MRDKSIRPAGRRCAPVRMTAEEFGRTGKALRKLMERRSIPFIRLGRKIVRELDLVDAMIAQLPGNGLGEAVEQRRGKTPHVVYGYEPSRAEEMARIASGQDYQIEELGPDHGA
jgi:hypothetical protein